jgi:hypothetical protein
LLAEADNDPVLARKLFAAAALSAVAALCAGCGSSSGGSSSVPSATATLSAANLTRAAYVSGSHAGVKLEMTMHETLPGLGSISMTGSGAFQRPDGQLVMNMSLPPAAGTLAHLEMTMILYHGTMFMKLPESLASKLPGGRQWLSIDLSELGKAEGVPGLGSLLSSSGQFTNDDSQLSYLRAVSGNVQNLGSETVNGVQTTHYRAEVDFSKLLDVAPAGQSATFKTLVAEMRKTIPGGHSPIDVWIGSDHLVRREVFNEPLTIQGKRANVSMQVDYLSYGPQPEPTPPPASQVTSLTSLLSSGA